MKLFFFSFGIIHLSLVDCVYVYFPRFLHRKHSENMKQKQVFVFQPLATLHLFVVNKYENLTKIKKEHLRSTALPVQWKVAP